MSQKLSAREIRKLKAAILDRIIFSGSRTLDTIDIPGSTIRIRVEKIGDRTSTITIL